MNITDQQIKLALKNLERDRKLLPYVCKLILALKPLPPKERFPALRAAAILQGIEI
jgi:hypothetical protein